MLIQFVMNIPSMNVGRTRYTTYVVASGNFNPKINEIFLKEKIIIFGT